MNDKVRILTLTGDYISLEQWQQQYGLKVGSTQIGKYYRYDEGHPKRAIGEFMENITNQGELIVPEPLIMVMDKARELHDKARYVNSFNRSEAEQVALRKLEKRAAEVSPHVVKLAVDIDTDTKADTELYVRNVREAAEQLNIKVRIGWKDYMADGHTFVHIDVCPEYYAKGKPWHKSPHKPSWENAIEW